MRKIFLFVVCLGFLSGCGSDDPRLGAVKTAPAEKAETYLPEASPSAPPPLSPADLQNEIQPEPEPAPAPAPEPPVQESPSGFEPEPEQIEPAPEQIEPAPEQIEPAPEQVETDPSPSPSPVRSGDAKLLLVDTFESGVIDYDQVQGGGTYSGTYWTSGNHVGPWRVIESKVPARAGGRYLKSSIGTKIAAMSGANNQYRTELVDPTRKRIMRTNWLGEENWVGFSVYLPSAEFTKRSGGSEWDRDIVFQWHEVDRSENRVAFMIGTDYRNGAMQWRLEQGWQGGGAKPWLDATAHPVVLDRWTDWVMNVKWDHRAAGNGFMKVWKDGKLVLDYKGPTMYDHVNGPIWKLGLYKGWWRDGTHPEQAEPIRSAYHDEFRIGDGSASYDMVAP